MQIYVITIGFSNEKYFDVNTGWRILPEIVPSDVFPSHATLHGLVPLKV
jgi:hypothetical protein